MDEEIWQFTMEGDVVMLRSRMVGDGIIGDARDKCLPGGEWLGMTYDQFRQAGAGSVKVVNERAEIIVVDVTADIIHE